MYILKIKALITANQICLDQLEILIDGVCQSFEINPFFGYGVDECELTFEKMPQLSVEIVRETKKFQVGYNLLKIVESTFEICRCAGSRVEVLFQTLDKQ
jgi:hypothetical protein